MHSPSASPDGEPRYDVTGIGNAIVDVLSHADDAFLEKRAMRKGSMTLIDSVQALELYQAMSVRLECSGGSAANTMAGIASLGGRGAYIGRVRDDALGATFRRGLTEIGVSFETPAATGGPDTARCLIFVTPDAQRTMHTYLGASATLGPEQIREDTVRDARITFLEGYLFDPPAAKKAFFTAASIAHDAGRRVALTLSDPFCVERHRDEFLELVEGHVDVLLANELEILALYQVDRLEQAVARLDGSCEISAITRGPRGSLILHGGRCIEIAAERVEQVVDTTGAGDLYAAGFLYGVSRGRDLELCGRLGSIAAAEVISHWGARPQTDLRQLAAAKLGVQEL